MGKWIIKRLPRSSVYLLTMYPLFRIAGFGKIKPIWFLIIPFQGSNFDFRDDCPSLGQLFLISVRSLPRDCQGSSWFEFLKSCYSKDWINLNNVHWNARLIIGQGNLSRPRENVTACVQLTMIMQMHAKWWQYMESNKHITGYIT